ncbi:MAG: DUF1801 domain-containing protein [Saprospiraceae bacterium]|nr:DUF1801 domain-containing protein [Saprospiraceae bacterium]
MNDFKTVDAYITSFEGKTREYLLQLREIIHECVPNTQELINYNIAAFTLMENGKREEQLMIAGYKNHVGFYPHPSTMEKFWNQLDGFKKAKGSVQFPLNRPLPKEIINEMIKYRLNLLNE